MPTTTPARTSPPPNPYQTEHTHLSNYPVPGTIVQCRMCRGCNRHKELPCFTEQTNGFVSLCADCYCLNERVTQRLKDIQPLSENGIPAEVLMALAIILAGGLHHPAILKEEWYLKAMAGFAEYVIPAGQNVGKHGLLIHALETSSHARPTAPPPGQFIELTLDTNHSVFRVIQQTR